MKKKHDKGFTLIELIIVVAIIGILASIAVPKFGDIQRDAKVKADLATARVIQQVAELRNISGEISDGKIVLDNKKDSNDDYSEDLITSMLQQNPVNNFGCTYVVKIVKDKITVDIKKGEVEIQIYPTIHDDPYKLLEDAINKKS